MLQYRGPHAEKWTFFLKNIADDTAIPIYKKKSNKYKLKESYDHLSGKKTKSLYIYIYIYIYIKWLSINKLIEDTISFNSILNSI